MWLSLLFKNSIFHSNNKRTGFYWSEILTNVQSILSFQMDLFQCRAVSRALFRSAPPLSLSPDLSLTHMKAHWQRTHLSDWLQTTTHTCLFAYKAREWDLITIEMRVESRPEALGPMYHPASNQAEAVWGKLNLMLLQVHTSESICCICWLNLCWFTAEAEIKLLLVCIHTFNQSASWTAKLYAY